MTTVSSSPALTRDFLTLTPEELRTGACVLSPDVVSRLGAVLEQHRSVLSRDLGLSLSGPVDHELWAWCRRPGSTLFVLASVLESVARQDCFTWLHLDMEQHLMRLHLAIEGAPPALTPGGPSMGGGGGLDSPARPQFQQVTTNSQFSIRQALQTSLGAHLSRFEIIGPESWVTWDTQANHLRGRQLTLRYVSDDTHSKGSHDMSSLESEITRVKQVYSAGDTNSATTDVQKLYLDQNGVVDSGETFVKGLFESGETFLKGFSESGGSARYRKGSDDGGGGSQFGSDGLRGKRVEDSLSATPVKQLAGSDEETQLKNLADDETRRKSVAGDDDDDVMSDRVGLGQYETYVKEIYVEETEETSYQEESLNLFQSYSNNATPMDSSVQREGEMGLSDSVIVHPPDTFLTLDQDTFAEPCVTHCSHATSKLPISRENIHQEISDMKTLPDKDMSKHHYHGSGESLDASPAHPPSHATSSRTIPPQSSANVPNLSLLHSGTPELHSEFGYRGRELSVAEVSDCSNLSPVARGQNDLNCLSVSTATRFKANFPRCGALSLAEKPHLRASVDITQEEGDKSNSDNRILDTDDYDDEDAFDGGPSADDGGRGDGDVVCMETTDHETAAKCVTMSASTSPPLKRQRSEPTDISDPSTGRTASHNVTNGDAHNMPPLEARPELDCEMVQHQHQQNSISFSHEPSHGLLPPSDNLYRHTPPPPYLVKDPPFQPPPYSSVAQAVSSRQAQIPSCSASPSIIQFSRISQPLFSNPQMSRSDQIPYTNVPGHLSAPAQLPTQSQHSGAPSSAHYVTMAGPSPAPPHTGGAPIVAGGGMEFSPTAQFSSSQPHNLVMNFSSRGVSGTAVNQTPNPNFRHGNNTPNTHHGLFGRVVLPAVATTQPRPVTSRPLVPPFQPAPLVMPAARHNAPLSAAYPNANASRQGQGQVQGHDRRSLPAAPARVEADVDSEHYIYPDQAGAVGSAIGQPRPPVRSRVSLEDELRELPGWCPDVNGDNIQKIMRDYLHQDGAFIIWRSRRHNKFVITVSHQGNLVYLLVRELQPRSRDGGPVYYLFENDGFRSDSILALYRHYRSHGIQMNITSQQGRQHMEHIYLRGPIRVRVTRRRIGEACKTMRR
ncbi:hypothetical protein ElyMa_002573300 [Elysia marginata]|uniref:SH2 domain-containing protein n=1 Tax=Elysia marginata TaxID=1093978 RepID=A0AAV4H017_9GAST|nr:hypothetical protein ElyMa_002573300 [Elysia marginata]